MKNTMITELVRLKALESTTDDQLLAAADNLNDFLSNQEGFVDSELVKPMEGNEWYFIYHFGSMEKLKAIGEKLRSNNMFDEISRLIVPGSFGVTFYSRVKEW